MNTIQAIKTMIMSVANEMDIDDKTELLNALYELTDEIDGQILDADEDRMYEEDWEDVSMDSLIPVKPLELKKLKKPAVPPHFKSLYQK